MHFDEIVKSLGEFGTYQKRLYFLLCIPSVFCAFHMVIPVFLVGTPKHRCVLPNYPNDTYSIQSDHHRGLVRQFIPPSINDKALEYSRCYINTISENTTTGNVTQTTCTSWVYDTTVFKSTFTSEQNLVCKDSFWTSHAKMFFNGGVLVGAISLGALSDSIGRKKTLYISIWLLLGSTLGVSWAPEKISFCILRGVVGVAYTGLLMTSFVTGMELVGPSKRFLAGIVIKYFFAVGLVICGGIGYAFRHWKYINIVCSAPAVLLLTYWWIIPESPRWLISQGRLEEATKIIQKAAKVNKVSLPDGVLDRDSVEEPPKGRLLDLFTSRVLLRRTLVIFFNWVVVSMVYYGLSLNSGNLGGDFYLNFFLTGLVEFPAYTICLFLLDRVGRKILYMAFMTLGGLACASTIFTTIFGDESLQPVTVALAMIGKLGIAAAFDVLYLWSAEIYPTVVRNAGMGACSSCVGIGGMVAPYVLGIRKMIEGNLGRALPLVVFGVATVIAGMLSIYLPETRNQNLPETIEDGKNFKGKRIKSSTNIYSIQDAVPEMFTNKAFENELLDMKKSDVLY